MTKILCAAIALAIAPSAFAEPEDTKDERPPRPTQKELVAKYDKDGNGKLSDKERVPMLKERMKEQPKLAAKLLKKYDTDKDGKLSDAELMAASKKMRLERKAKKAKEKAEAAE